MLLASRGLAVAFPDAFPVSPGHCLVIPRRHEPDYFKLSREEQEEVWEIVWELRELLEAEHDTTSFNVGINAGEARRTDRSACACARDPALPRGRTRTPAAGSGG